MTAVQGVSAGGVQLLTRHHRHEGHEGCCTCGGRWPCIPAMHLEDQIAAYVRENGGVQRIAVDPHRVKALGVFIESIYGGEFQLTIVIDIGD